MFSNSPQQHKKAIAYYRHSAEDKQENSVGIQRQHTEKFASEHNIEIIHEEADEGKSGLLATRPAFERLFTNWIENPNAPYFDYVLVYDVSRWGRFQDQDQAGYFVYLCKKQGKQVVYVSRGFPDSTNQLISSLETSIHRYMAAEYSRQLSDKVFYGCVKVSEQGYSAGGKATYGMARQLMDSNKKPIRILNAGEHKQIANERVSFIPKNDYTTEAIREIFNLFVEKYYSVADICIHLNEKGLLSANGKLWSNSMIVRILTDETYIGTRIYNRKWKRLKQKLHRNPRSEWIIVPNAFNATIDQELFHKAQERLYWLFPNNWKKGIFAVKKARKNILRDIHKWLLNEGATEYEANNILSELPIIFSVKNENKENPLWCFLISEDIRKYNNALAVSVITNSKNVIDDFFLFSVDDFTRSGFLILSDNSTLFKKSKIESSSVEQTIKLLIKQFKELKLSNKDKCLFTDSW